MTVSVELQHVSKAYGDFHALTKIDLQLREGEVMGLLGHNGAGKTTTMKLILGVITASTGKVKLFGESPTGPHADNLRRHMGYLPENVSFYNQLSGREVLAYFGKLKGVGHTEQMELLERVGLSEAARRRVKTYSKGMRQRLGLAQALLGRPRLLLLDEPTVGLDPAATRDFYAMLAELRQHGTTILLSSHVLPGIEKHIDRAAILGSGHLLALGTLNELSQEAQIPLVIRVRGHWPGMDWQQQLQDKEIDCRTVNDSQLELRLPTRRKLEVMRLLLAEPSVQDIELIQPSLDSLYSYFSKPELTR